MMLSLSSKQLLYNTVTQLQAIKGISQSSRFDERMWEASRGSGGSVISRKDYTLRPDLMSGKSIVV